MKVLSMQKAVNTWDGDGRGDGDLKHGIRCGVGLGSPAIARLFEVDRGYDSGYDDGFGR